MSIDRNNIEAPELLDIGFFKDALENGLNQTNIDVKNVIFTTASKPGENYCSIIYRTDVTYSTSNLKSETKSLIVKSLPQNAATEIFKKLDVFGTETNVYTQVLSKMDTILHGESIAPKFYYYTKTPIDTIVFEDVTPLGYELADRVKGLDEEHCALVLQKLAKFHAASMDLALKYPETIERFKKGFFSEEKPSDLFHASFTRNLESLAKLTETWDGFETFSKKITTFTESVMDHFIKANASVDNEIKVLTHSDLWTNNILFKYDNQRVKDAFLIDFQGTIYCSPGIDIVHFLYTSPQYSVLTKKRDFIIEEYYYKTLKETLEDLDYSPIPTLEDIFNDIHTREMSGFLWSVCKLYLICMDKDKCGENNFDNIADIEKGQIIRDIGMSSERYQETMKYILRRMVQVGVL